MAVRPPNPQRDSGSKGNPGNYANKLQRAVIREAASRTAE
jgi:hypothetical protein